MRPLVFALLALLLTGCQINPYTFQPTWTGTSWFTAGKEDAMNGASIKSNETLADNFNDPDVNRSEYLRGYADGQKRICTEDFVYAWGLSGKIFPASCDTAENSDLLRHAWQKGMDEGLRASRLN